MKILVNNICNKEKSVCLKFIAFSGSLKRREMCFQAACFDMMVFYGGLQQNKANIHCHDSNRKQKMIALIQRVKHAHVSVNQEIVGQIQQGLLVLLGVEQNDTPAQADRLLERVLSYRVFSDEMGKMNVNVKDAGGALLVVSQFTLVADTQKGTRPSFSKGAKPDVAEQLYHHFCQQAKQQIHTETGQFAAEMQVNLQNDGPVTFWLQV